MLFSLEHELKLTCFILKGVFIKVSWLSFPKDQKQIVQTVLEIEDKNNMIGILIVIINNISSDGL